MYRPRFVSAQLHFSADTQAIEVGAGPTILDQHHCLQNMLALQ